MKSCVGFFFLLTSTHFTFAQNEPAASLQLQFQNYQSNVPQEKLYVHTDKTFYLAGETIWFKVYSVDASFHKPFPASRIAYIEIFNKDLKPVVQTKVSLLNGKGNGSFILPGSLPSGSYVFRSYTSWMKNFSSDFYFEQTLHVVNTLKLTPTAVPQKKTASIQFFPEGGNSLSGYDCTVAFKAVDTEGHGLDCQGVVVSQQNDTVAHFKSFFKGMGSFQLKSSNNNSYYAVCFVGDTIIKQKLPDALDHGISLHISANDTDKLEVIVHASADFDNTTVYLLAQTRQLIKNFKTSTIKNGNATFTVNKRDLGDGISGITIFDQSLQPVCERLVFKRPQETVHIEVKPDQAVYGSRKPVNIQLNTQYSNSGKHIGDFSLSVIMIDSLQTVPEENIISYLYLNSELKGNIESPDYYFTNNDANEDVAMSNLLLTQGWRRFKWKDITENKKPYIEFLPEVEGPVVNGRIINKLTGSPAGQVDAYLSVPGSDYAFSSATSDKQGQIRFAFKDIYKNNVLVFQPALAKDSIYRIDITSAYSDKLVYSPFQPLTLGRNLENTLLSKSISNQVENTYAVDKKRRYAILNSDSSSFYGKPGRQYNLDDYTRFQTMEEVMREYVEDVRVRKEGNKFNFKVVNRSFGTYFEEDPLILLDGIPVTDATKIIELDPLKIKRIEVVTHNYFLGSSEFEGIVNVKSYSGEMGAPLINPNALVVEYDGIQQQREFYSPTYESSADLERHLPDFRNVLEWVPQLTIGNDGKSNVSFYSSDLKGKFAVIIQGISTNGIPGRAVGFFEVEDSK
jgi:hypothetical protein